MASTREDDPRLTAAALEQLYAKLEKPMFNVVYRWLWDAGEAQDVVQDAFLRVWDARDRVDLATVEPLLYRTAMNLASNRRRKKRFFRWLGLEGSEEPRAEGTCEEEVVRAHTHRRVREAVEALPEPLKEVILLAEYSEMSYAAIAAVLGIPPGTVGSRRNAALARLAEALGGLEEGTP